MRVSSTLAPRWLDPASNARTAVLGALALFLAGCSDEAIGVEPHASTTRIFVDAGATGSDSGSSWANAHGDLQAALARAQAGDEIWVRQGIYRPASGPGDRNATFRLKSGVAVYGGFRGIETVRDDRDWIHNITILSGDLAGDDAQGPNHRHENAYQVVTAVDTDHHTVLDGFTITAGVADGPGFGATPESREQGSAVNIYYGGPTLANCTIYDNWNTNHGAVNDHGHATRIENCSFRDNVARGFGAGLYLHHEAATQVVDCTFFDNHTPGEGGGAYTRSMHGATLTRCTFVGNTANLGGGMYHAEGSRTTLVDSTFHSNDAALGGGGVYGDTSDVQLLRCEFRANTAGLGIQDGGGGVGGSGGGGVWTNGGSPLVEECVFDANQASLGGGMYIKDFSLATVRACSFRENSATEAGGLYILNSEAHVLDSTFVENVATGDEFSVGGGLANYYSNSTTVNCVFERNRSDLGGGGVYNEGEFPTLMHCSFVQNSALGLSEGWGGGVLNFYFTEPVIANCTFAANVARRGGGMFNIIFSRPAVRNCTFSANTADQGGAVSSFNGSTPTFANSIFWGNAPDELFGTVNEVVSSCVRGSFAGTRIIDVDPGFVRAPGPGLDDIWGTADDDSGDLRLAEGSPCVDAGDNSFVPGAVVTDMDGRPRFTDDPAVTDTGVGAPPIVDLGPFER